MSSAPPGEVTPVGRWPVAVSVQVETSPTLAGGVRLSNHAQVKILLALVRQGKKYPASQYVRLNFGRLSHPMDTELGRVSQVTN